MMQTNGSFLQAAAASLQNGGEEVMSEDEARKRREQLNRRPSYRMILKDLETADKNLKKEPEDEPASGSSPSNGGAGPTGSLGTSPLVSMAGSGAAPLHVQIPGVRNALTGSGSSPYSSPLGAAAAVSAGMLPPSAGLAAVTAAQQLQHLNGAAAGDLSLAALDYNSQQVAAAAALVAASRGQTSAITPTTSSGTLQSGDMHGVKMMSELSAPNSFTGNVTEWSSLMSGYSSSPSPTMGAGGSRMGGGGMGGCEDESSRKRQKLQVRLLKNREAAKECRRKKKEYVKCLENRVAVLENQNKALIEELKTLKELYCRKEKTDM